MSSTTGFASVDGTDGFTRTGTPLSFNGIFRHKDDFGRLYFEITQEDFTQLSDKYVDEDDNVSPIYEDDYWHVPMVKGRFKKTVDIFPIVEKIDNRLIHNVKGQIFEMAPGSIIDEKPYSGTYFTIESVNVLSKQPKEVQKASADYLSNKADKAAAEERESAREKSKPKKRKAPSKKKAPKKAKAKKTKAKKSSLIDDEAEDEDEDDVDEDAE